MRVLVTGGCGFIGSTIAGSMAGQGAEVMVADRVPSPRMKSSRGVSVAIGDLLDRDFVDGVFKDFRPTAVVHAAWTGVVGSERNAPAQLQNVTAMGNILEACARRGVGRLVGIGSQAEYGVHNVRIDETAVPRPETLYGVCKLAAGLSGKEFAVRHSLCYAWLRLFSTFGPGDYTDYVLPYAIESLLKGQRPRLSPCQQKWDYLYVEDIPKLIWKVVAAAGPFCDVFNLASGAPVRLKDAILTVREIIATPVEPDFGAHPGAKGGLVHLEGDPGKFIRTFGWITLTPLREALGNTVAWFRARLGEPSRGAGE